MVFRMKGFLCPYCLETYKDYVVATKCRDRCHEEQESKAGRELVRRIEDGTIVHDFTDY